MLDDIGAANDHIEGLGLPVPVGPILPPWLSIPIAIIKAGPAAVFGFASTMLAMYNSVLLKGQLAMQVPDLYLTMRNSVKQEAREPQRILMEMLFRSIGFEKKAYEGTVYNNTAKEFIQHWMLRNRSGFANQFGGGEYNSDVGWNMFGRFDTGIYQEGWLSELLYSGLARINNDRS